MSNCIIIGKIQIKSALFTNKVLKGLDFVRISVINNLVQLYNIYFGIRNAVYFKFMHLYTILYQTIAVIFHLHHKINISSHYWKVCLPHRFRISRSAVKIVSRHAIYVFKPFVTTYPLGPKSLDRLTRRVACGNTL